MNTENQLQEQLDALSKINLDELRDLCRKYFHGIKHCRSKILLRKKISFMIQAEAWGCLNPSLQKQISELGLGQPRVKNNKGFITGTTFTRKWKEKTYHLVAVADGFVMDGQKFKSLSGAAMAVTGTQWSGKVFLEGEIMELIQKRCAIYTRKSVDEGLEQEFNSLDAQRNLCESYVVSAK